jgi:hypothetical protein
MNCSRVSFAYLGRQLADHLNAEIVGGTVSTIREGREPVEDVE